MKAVVPKTRPMLDAGGVSATDIIMNLFVFFFIAFSLLATFSKDRHDSQQAERQQQILLPASQREAPLVPADAVMVELNVDQRARVDGKEVEGQKVTEAVKAALGPHRKNVVVRADKALSLGTAVSLMDQVWAAGPESVAIATLAAEGKP